MQRSTARTVANVVLGAAGVALAWVVFRKPPLRRAAGRLAKAAITRGIPGLLASEVGKAWASSGTRPSTEIRAGPSTRAHAAS